MVTLHIGRLYFRSLCFYITMHVIKCDVFSTTPSHVDPPIYLANCDFYRYTTHSLQYLGFLCYWRIVCTSIFSVTSWRIIKRKLCRGYIRLFITHKSLETPFIYVPFVQPLFYRSILMFWLDISFTYLFCFNI